MENTNIRVNVLSVPTWNKLKINDAIVRDLTAPVAASCMIRDDGEALRDTLDQGLFVKKLPTEIMENTMWSKVKADSDEAVRSYFAEIAPIDYRIVKKQEKPAIFDIACADGVCSAVSLRIRAEADATIILRAGNGAVAGSEMAEAAGKAGGAEKADSACGTGEESSRGLLGVYINADIAPGVTLHVIQVNLLQNRYRVLSYIKTDCAEKARCELTTVALGGEEGYYGAKTNLIGNDSSFDTHTAYILEENTNLDMNYVADQYGTGTDANLFSAGVLKRGSYKASRQTVNFISGSAGSKGVENEEVLLLDDDIINKSAPLILCTEEDVEGEHGASIGQPDESVIFYLESRGIPLEQIYEILSVAKIEAALARIPDENTVESVRQYLQAM